MNSEKYAIPLENVRETVRVPMEAVHTIADNGVFKLRNEVLPILNIHNEFGGSSEVVREMPAIIVEEREPGMPAGVPFDRSAGDSGEELREGPEADRVLLGSDHPGRW